MNVRKLTLAMDFSRDNTIEESGILPQYNHIQELKSVVTTCRRLEDLTVICSTKRKETFFYVSLSVFVNSQDTQTCFHFSERFF